MQQKLNFLEGVCPVTSGVKTTKFLIDCDHVKYSSRHIKNISSHDTHYLPKKTVYNVRY